MAVSIPLVLMGVVLWIVSGRVAAREQSRQSVALPAAVG
jgi:hypothetical protein